MGCGRHIGAISPRGHTPHTYVIPDGVYNEFMLADRNLKFYRHRMVYYFKLADHCGPITVKPAGITTGITSAAATATSPLVSAE